jgi:hypothetical protein
MHIRLFQPKSTAQNGGQCRVTKRGNSFTRDYVDSGYFAVRAAPNHDRGLLRLLVIVAFPGLDDAYVLNGDIQ